MRVRRTLARSTAVTLSCVVIAVVAQGTVVTGTSDAAQVVAGATAGVSTTVHDTAAIRQVGALFRNGRHFCTASVVQSGGRNLLVTAAHCVSGGAAGLTFAPGYHDGTAPYGVWRVTRVFTDAAWQASQDQDHDVAFVEVAPLAGRQVQDVVGGGPLDTGGRDSGRVTLVGYPDSGDAPLVCSNTITAFSATQNRIYCTAYTDGTSGGPWLGPDGRVVGVIGGYQQGGDTADVSYSVTFGQTVAALYGYADATAAQS